MLNPWSALGVALRHDDRYRHQQHREQPPSHDEQSHHERARYG